MKKKHEIRWTTGSGYDVSVKIELITAKQIDCDGDKTSVACCDLIIDCDVAWIGWMGGEIVRKSGRDPKGTEYAAIIGRLPVSQENLNKIDAAIADCKSQPEWIAKEARSAQCRKESDEYDAHQRAMRSQDKWTY